MAFFSPTPTPAQDFIRVQGIQFIKNGQPYHYLGVNYWYGMNLGSQAPSGNRERLLRELDQLKELGIDNLRIMAATEGPDSEPWRIVPALQSEPGVYEEDLLEGLDFLLVELGKRDMHAVLCLNNMWPWSGGFGQYLKWTTGQDIPYPPPAAGGKWLAYIKFVARFFSNEAAQQLYLNHIQFIVNRVNSISGVAYKNDPTIMSWQLANEPRPLLGNRKYRRWIKKTAAYIRQLDPQHLISIGSEGNAFLGWSSKFKREHKIKNIDYATAHVWIENWGWYDPQKGSASFQKALKKAKSYVRSHLQTSRKLKMPFVLEEFGIARDKGSFEPSATVNFRDRYYAELFELLQAEAQKDGASAACNIWAWGGEGRPRQAKAIWKAGDDFIGDPPFEHQGWYSVYDQDQSTLNVLATFAEQFKTIKF